MTFFFVRDARHKCRFYPTDMTCPPQIGPGIMGKPLDVTRFNAQFERETLRPGDLHRPLRKSLNLEEIFCLKATRTIHNGYFVRWKGKRYAIEAPSRWMKGQPALIIEHFDGRMRVRFEGHDLRY